VLATAENMVYRYGHGALQHPLILGLLSHGEVCVARALSKKTVGIDLAE
jgi:hypothetical protein